VYLEIGQSDCTGPQIRTPYTVQPYSPSLLYGCVHLPHMKVSKLVTNIYECRKLLAAESP
jgi:hypothetical protein